MWLDPERFNCATCTSRDREELGHSAPADRPVPWNVDVPPGVYAGDDDPDRYRCPKLSVTPWVDAIAEMHFVSQQFHSPPLAGGTALWPAKLRAALLYLEAQYAAKRQRAAEEARAKLPQFPTR